MSIVTSEWIGWETKIMYYSWNKAKVSVQTSDRLHFVNSYYYCNLDRSPTEIVIESNAFRFIFRKIYILITTSNYYSYYNVLTELSIMMIGPLESKRISQEHLQQCYAFYLIKKYNFFLRYLLFFFNTILTYFLFPLNIFFSLFFFTFIFFLKPPRETREKWLKK